MVTEEMGGAANKLASATGKNRIAKESERQTLGQMYPTTLYATILY